MNPASAQANPRDMLVASLHVHPIKSAAGVQVADLELDAFGAVGDRRWMLVDRDGLAITARVHHRLLQLKPSFAGRDRDGALRLDSSGLQTMVVQVPGAAHPRSVVIWKDHVEAHDAGELAAEWCSDAIGFSCRLVRIAPEARRPLKAKHAGPIPREGRAVAFSDGAPLLLLGTGSLDALNDRLGGKGAAPVTERRFRPNVLLSGVGPHEEDGWRSLFIGDVALGVGSSCQRCVMTTIDGDTGAQGVEPLRTLAGYRRLGSGVVFGVNATHAAPGTIRVGDRVQVTSLAGDLSTAAPSSVRGSA